MGLLVPQNYGGFFMFNRVLMAFAIALGGSLAIATTANAQSVDIPFNGTVPFQCAFGPVSPGVLTPDGGTLTFSLSSLYPGGVNGNTSILCNASADINVTSVTQLAGQPITNLSTETFVNGTPSLPVSPGVDTNLDVSLTVGSLTDPLEPGDYTYQVTLTAVP
jgi:hypothetical protein